MYAGQVKATKERAITDCGDWVWDGDAGQVSTPDKRLPADGSNGVSVVIIGNTFRYNNLTWVFTAWSHIDRSAIVIIVICDIINHKVVRTGRARKGGEEQCHQQGCKIFAIEFHIGCLFFRV